MSMVRFEKDYSANSLGVLSDKVRAVIRKKIPDASIWIPDMYEEPVFPENQIVDVVFFGDFFRKFLETGNWTPEKYRLWCLGVPTKRFFTEIVNLRESQISVLPRNLLFNIPENFNIPEMKTDATEFVYAGRLTPSKRILTMLWSVFHLQEMGHDVSMTLYGEFFQEEKFCDCPGANPYEDKVRALISKLPWKHVPKISGKVGKEEWLKHAPGRTPVYFSLSVLPFEDFSVSVAQAQELGWASILSNWGAQKNISGAVLKLPLQIFEQLNETERSAEAEGKMIAAYVASRQVSMVPGEEQSLIVPDITGLSDLDHQRRKFLQKWGMNLQDVIRHRTDDLKGSSRWNEFMKDYVKCFM